MSLWISHPTGNTFVRAVLAELQRREVPFEFFTTVGFPAKPGGSEGRRVYSVPAARLHTSPWLETARLLHQAVFKTPPHPERPWSVDGVYRALDRTVARALRKAERSPESVLAYEDGALEQFRAAAELGVHRVYDLPIAYWETVRRLLGEEAARLPEWEPTLLSTADSAAKLERKTEEIELADCVICPSEFVFNSLPPKVRMRKQCVVSPFGSPPVKQLKRPTEAAAGGKLKVLFVGALSQRKGLADLFEAMRLLKRNDVELRVAGARLLPLEFYRGQCPQFIYEAPREHARILQLMLEADLFVLPSIVEGRALVQQEALACGMPLLVTRNAGGDDLIEPGRTGFLVPPRSPQAIAERIDWFASNRDALEAMRPHCRRKAAEYSWELYAGRILDEINFFGPNGASSKATFGDRCEIR